MIRYAASTDSRPEPPQARVVSAAKPALEMRSLTPIIDAAVTAPAAGLLPPSPESDEIGSDTRPKTPKPPRRAATKRKPKVEADDTSLQLSLDT
ncbi:poly(hydroxyalkanoate) granule-associated protein [Rhizobium anhuiense]|jgi:hypothetical protein|nr:poly(hydroxyalkanoate) granule-associated protein [Rhizobium anhuiense]